MWHPDIEAYEIHEGDKLLGRFFLDMHPRADKYQHAAQWDLANGRAGKTLPEGVLMCNFPKPGAEPALMQHGDVETFFHEFGHLLHHLLGGQGRWAGASGVRTEHDFVEAPSQMLEEWAWAPESLSTFARHYQSNEPLPPLQVRPGHLLPPVLRPPRWVLGRLLHLYVVAGDREGSLHALPGRGADEPTPAMRYRRAVLEPGGTQGAALLVKDFLGREYGFDAYERWLNGQ